MSEPHPFEGNSNRFEDHDLIGRIYESNLDLLSELFQKICNFSKFIFGAGLEARALELSAGVPDPKLQELNNNNKLFVSMQLLAKITTCLHVYNFRETTPQVQIPFSMYLDIYDTHQAPEIRDFALCPPQWRSHAGNGSFTAIDGRWSR